MPASTQHSPADPEHSRSGLGRRLRARPRLLIGGLVVAAAGIALVLWWFQPQALLFDRVVDEEFPTVGETPERDAASTNADDGEPVPGEATVGSLQDPDDGDASEEPSEEGAQTHEPQQPGAAEVATAPHPLAAGSFASRNRYTVTGEATIYALEDGRRTVRLEPFESTNGPDLYVYLTAANHADDDEALAADHVDLGELRGNVGNQNYELPAEVDLAVYDTVVIWCRRFATSFGAADLLAAD